MSSSLSTRSSSCSANWWVGSSWIASWNSSRACGSRPISLNVRPRWKAPGPPSAAPGSTPSGTRGCPAPWPAPRGSSRRPRPSSARGRPPGPAAGLSSWRSASPSRLAAPPPNGRRQGQEAAHELNWDAAVYYYLEALAREPGNLEYRMALTRARLKAGQEHFQRGLAFRELGRLQQARDEFQLAVQLDPTHQFAEQELERVNKDLDILARPDGERTLEEMKAKARQAKVQPPILNPRSKEPITLTFPKPKPVKEIYQAMAKAYGFNVMFDQPSRTTKSPSSSATSRPSRRSSASCRPPDISTRCSTRTRSSSCPIRPRRAASTRTWSSARSICRTATPNRSTSSSGR